MLSYMFTLERGDGADTAGDAHSGEGPYKITKVDVRGSRTAGATVYGVVATVWRRLKDIVTEEI